MLHISELPTFFGNGLGVVSGLHMRRSEEYDKKWKGCGCS
jgi:hypothetical protein